MRVQGKNFQISGNQSAFPVNVTDFGYSDSEKLDFINDLLLGHIDKKDLLERVTDTDTEHNAAALNVGNRNSFDRPTGTFSIQAEKPSDQFLETDCKLQGVFVGSLDSLSSSQSRCTTNSSRRTTSVFMVPITVSEATQFRSQSKPPKPSQVVDNLYRQLGKKETSIVEGELYCTKHGSELHLAQEVTRFPRKSQRHSRHLKTSSEKTLSKSQNRYQQRSHERGKPQSIQPGTVRRLREKFAADDASSSSCTYGDTKHPAFRAETSTNGIGKQHQINKNPTFVKNAALPRKVAIEVITDISHPICTDGSELGDAFSANASRFRNPKKLKNAPKTQNSLEFCRPTKKKQHSMTVPSPSTGNSLAYNYWALSDSHFDEHFCEEMHDKECARMSGCPRYAWKNKTSALRSPEFCDAYEDSFGLDPTCYFDESERDCATSFHSRFQCSGCVSSDSCQSLQDSTKAEQGRQYFREQPNSSQDLANTGQKQRIDFWDAKLERQKFHRHKNDGKMVKPRLASTNSRVINKKKRNGFPADSSSRSQKRSNHSLVRQQLASPKPRSVDFIEYPFTASSSEEDYEQIEEVLRKTSATGSKLTSKKPPNFLRKAQFNTATDTDDSMLNFEDLKKENEKLASLRQQFARGLQFETAEDTDESERNPEKVAYDKRVRHFTKPPPALKPKTSLTFEDRRKLGLIEIPDPSASNFHEKVYHMKKHKIHYRKSVENLGKPMLKSTKERKPIKNDHHGISPDSDYYFAPQPSARGIQQPQKGRIQHKKRSFASVPITKKSFSASCPKFHLNSLNDSRSNSTDDIMPTITNKFHPCKKVSKHVFPAEKPHAECKSSSPIPTSKQKYNQKNVIIKPGKSLCLSQNIAQTSKKVEMKLGGKSKSFENLQLKRIPCTPSHEAISCAQECPIPLCRREWNVDGVSLAGNFSNNIIPDRNKRTTLHSKES